MMAPRLALLIGALILEGCAAAPMVPVAGTNGSLAAQLSGRYVDLSYSYGPDTLYWPTARRFSIEEVAKGATEGGYWYEANNICTAEHGGTHMDAPVHFAKGQLTTDRVPVDAGIGPLVVLDVRDKARFDADYRVAVDDLKAWEASYGRIPNGAIVVMFSGWGERWPDAATYLGTNKPGDTANLHFPGFGEAAIRFLLDEREIRAIGVDTASIDHGPSTDFIVHRILHGAGKPAFENLANMDRVPAAGAMLIALPMKIEGGSGAPLRAIAVLPGSRQPIENQDTGCKRSFDVPAAFRNPQQKSRDFASGFAPCQTADILVFAAAPVIQRTTNAER